MTEPIRRWTGSCRARCALTGRTCALPAHAGVEHASGRYRFTQLAYAGQEYFPKAAELEAAAFGHRDAVIEESSTATRSERNRAADRRYQEKYRAKKRLSQVLAAAKASATQVTQPKEESDAA